MRSVPHPGSRDRVAVAVLQLHFKPPTAGDAAHAHPADIRIVHRNHADVIDGSAALALSQHGERLSDCDIGRSVHTHRAEQRATRLVGRDPRLHSGLIEVFADDAKGIGELLERPVVRLEHAGQVAAGASTNAPSGGSVTSIDCG